LGKDIRLLQCAEGSGKGINQTVGLRARVHILTFVVRKSYTSDNVLRNS